MNRRDFLGAAALAPLAAILSGIAKAETVTMTLKADTTALQAVVGQAAGELKYFTQRFPYGPPPLHLPPSKDEIRRLFQAVDDEIALADMAAYCDELVPIAEPEDEMLGG